MAPLIDEFVAGLLDRCRSIDAALASRDTARAAALAHKFVGAAASYGYPTIAEAARRVETLANEPAERALLQASAQAMLDLCHLAR